LHRAVFLFLLAAHRFKRRCGWLLLPTPGWVAQGETACVPGVPV
jgi:hypothetical protein